MARRSYTARSGGAKVVDDQGEAAQIVAAGVPLVLICADGEAARQALAGAGDRHAHKRLLAVMVGGAEPGGDDAAITAEAAEEMAAELWPWLMQPDQPDHNKDEA